MSRENVEVMRSVYRPGGPSRFFELLDEEVEQDVTAPEFFASRAFEYIATMAKLALMVGRRPAEPL